MLKPVDHIKEGWHNDPTETNQPLKRVKKMEKKITVYTVVTEAQFAAIADDNVKSVDGVHTVKTGVEVGGVPFTSKRQAVEAAELLAKFEIETTVLTQKRTVKLT